MQFIAAFDGQRALALAGRADVDHGLLDDQLLYVSEARARMDGATSKLDTMEIVQQCEASGSFPYRGVTEVIKNGRLPEKRRLALARVELTYAQQDSISDRYGLLNAPQALIAVHGMFPQLDAQTEDAAANILRVLDQGAGGGTMGAAGARMVGTFLLTEMKQMDATRASELAARYPDFVASSPMAATGPAMGAYIQARQAASADDLPPAPADTDAVMTRFAAYSQRAAVLQKKDPTEALDNARRAAALANADLRGQSGMPMAALQLASTLKTLGADRDAEDLLGRGLDALAASDAAREKQYRGGDAGAAQRFAQEQIGLASSATWQALVKADQVDFETTARHALA
ncbi:MAG: hypothetical protein ACRD2D_13965, partial [Terriglobales bacterium]